MNTETGKALERLVSEHRRKVAQIRADDSLSWEKREKAIKALWDKHIDTLKKLEEQEAA